MPEKILSDFQIGLQARRLEPDARPYGFVVEWIRWDSGFRGTALKVGDVITSLNGKVFEPGQKDFEFGIYSENQFWANAGVKDGDPALLTVIRDGETLKIAGKVRAERAYTTNDGRRALASPGPDSMAKDEFTASWASWDESLVKEMRDAGWNRNTRQQLESLLQHAPRIEALGKRFAGPYASAMKEDFDRAVEFIRGKKYDLGPDDLAYRSLTETRLQDAIDLAMRSWNEFIASVDATDLAALPVIDPVRGDRSAVVDKVVRVPEMNEISEAGHGWFWIQGAGANIYLIDQRSPVFSALLYAVLRFRELINPAIADRYQLVGKIGNSPAMVAIGKKKVYVGLTIEPIAALVDEKMFIDLRAGEASKFAGEENAKKLPQVDTRPDLGPGDVFAGWINALKLGDSEVWKLFYATWSCAEGRYDPEGGPPPNHHYRDWANARKQITGPVYDVRVVKVSPVRVVYEGQDARVEEVALVTDHIGLFDGEYRAFKDVNVNREWTMQRVSGGPWRITTEKGI
ncbi:MAG TPA: hypothetical protein VFX92_10730 [Candidatus Krumholzibacteria bacterium]|nr:hypothetical protein [Candidatus Krumholzibacteria bacterium]